MHKIKVTEWPYEAISVDTLRLVCVMPWQNSTELN